jgi:hypothetical protein
VLHARVREAVLVGVMAVTALPIAGRAQGGSSCDKFLDYGMNNITRVTSSSQRDVANYSKYCGSNVNLDSNELSVEAHVSIFGAGGGGGQLTSAQRKQAVQTWCNEQSSRNISSDQLSSYTSQVQAASVDAWKACIELTSSRLVEVSVRLGRDIVRFGLRWTGPVNSPGSVTGVTLIGFNLTSVDTSRGRITSPTWPMTLSSEWTTFVFTRTASRSETNPADNKRYNVRERGTIQLSTSMLGAETMFEFPEEWQPPIPEQRADALERQLRVVIPRGLIAAFDGACPNGWSPYVQGQGKFLLGASATRGAGQTGGQENATLTVANLPSHSHATQLASDPTPGHHQFGLGPVAATLYGTRWDDNPGSGQNVSPTGGGQPVDTMPPFVTVQYCKKD